MKKSYLIILPILYILSSCISNSQSQNTDIEHELLNIDSQNSIQKAEIKKLSSEELAGFLPESIEGFPLAQQILKSSDDGTKVSASRQYLDESYKKYIKVVVSDFPQIQDEYDKNWTQNASFENESKKVITERKDDVDVYKVILKDGSMKFTTFYTKCRFEVFVESRDVDDAELHYLIAEPILEKLKKQGN